MKWWHGLEYCYNFTTAEVKVVNGGKNKKEKKKGDLNGDPNENQQKLANSIVVSGALVQ